MLLQDHVVLVTGGAGEYGMAITERVLKQGGKVCMVDIDKEKLTDCAQRLFTTHGKENLTYFDCDVTQKQPFEAAFRHTRYVLGSVDILVNAAAVKECKDWQKNINVNLGAVLNCSDIAGDYFVQTNNSGVVVNVASPAGVRPEAYSEHPKSTAARAGVVAYTRCLSKDNPNVRMVCVCPPELSEEKSELPVRMTGTTETLVPFDNTDSPQSFAAFANTFESMVAQDNNNGTVIVMDTVNNVTVM